MLLNASCYYMYFNGCNGTNGHLPLMLSVISENVTPLRQYVDVLTNSGGFGNLFLIFGKSSSVQLLLSDLQIKKSK